MLYRATQLIGYPLLRGYFRPDDAKATAVMRPSTTFNEALTAL